MGVTRRCAQFLFEYACIQGANLAVGFPYHSQGFVERGKLWFLCRSLLQIDFYCWATYDRTHQHSSIILTMCIASKRAPICCRTLFKISPMRSRRSSCIRFTWVQWGTEWLIMFQTNQNPSLRVSQHIARQQARYLHLHSVDCLQSQRAVVVVLHERRPLTFAHLNDILHEWAWHFSPTTLHGYTQLICELDPISEQHFVSRS